MGVQAQPITEYVGSHPEAVWGIGPFFAALTGVAFKEGVCYGKLECALLFLLTPALLLGKEFSFQPKWSPLNSNTVVYVSKYCSSCPSLFSIIAIPITESETALKFLSG